MKKSYLFTPGPTPIPPEPLLAMAQPIDYHRSEDAVALIKDVLEKLKHVFQTENDVLFLTSSGTGAMDGAVANLLCRGDKVLVIRSGKFGERWAEICEAYGVEVVPIDVRWGDSVTPEIVETKLTENPDVQAVFATLCETSTGALHDIEALARLTQSSPTLLVVDAVSALGADDLQMDNWGVDVVVSCSQKGLMTPPGLAFAALNERAWEAVDRSDLPKYYLDFRKAHQRGLEGSVPYTPAITLLVGLQYALNHICAEGIRNTISRHNRMAIATRNAVKAIGLPLFATSPANTLTSIRLPKEIDGKAFVKMMREKHGITYAGGQGDLGGKIVRIAHLGWMNESDVIVAISAFERGLAEIGYDISLGTGVATAQEVFTKFANQER
ncbi:MAG: alanine--glyoxylate aminotransferase family protein [Candidatus Poribacteria bacterium]|nr:alanine--glyoxylate aminotransferase family protein [Candidatus Poribacteria bacterium]